MMANEHEMPAFKSNDKILNLLDTIHIEIARKYEAELGHTSHSYNYKINEFEVLLEKFYKTEKSPSFYASKMNMTLKHLNRICKNILGQTVTDIIGQRIILEAKRLLSDPTKSVAQIADALGYDNYPYFGKMFKKYTQITPGEFRKSIL
jgi:AraC family transcriptional activator of pobA